MNASRILGRVGSARVGSTRVGRARAPSLLAAVAVALAMVAPVASAKLPAPPAPTPEEKAKAAEAAARTAWSNKVADFQLCRSMERAAANFFEVAKTRGAAAAADPSAPACADPGPFAPPPPAAQPAK